MGNKADGQFEAVLTLRNNSQHALSGDWALYFNSTARLTSDSASFNLRHINGDFYELRPSGQKSRIEPGESRRIELSGGPWAINISDAPSGFYLVRHDDKGTNAAPLPLPLHVEAFPASEHLRRGAADVVPVVSPKSRYLENEHLRLLPLEQLVKVVPTPLTLEPRPGQVRVNRDTIIFFEPSLKNEADFLASALQPLLGTRLGIESLPSKAQGQGTAIRLRVSPIAGASSEEKHGPEAYTLDATAENGIIITGASAAGVFYGVQTLRALVPIEMYRRSNPELLINAVQIFDRPRFDYRGLHLDVARNFQTKETVKKLLDLMAFYKLSHLHFHLTDDEGWRIEIRELPELADVGGRRGHTADEADHLFPSYGSGPNPADSPGSGFYTQEDFVEILRHARSRHISVVPELDLPGHARAAVKAMEARHRRLMASDPQSAEEFLLREPGDQSQYESVQRWNDNVVDVGREATYRLLNVVVAELAAMYERAGAPLEMVHLGGDEVPAGVWGKSPACQQIAVEAGSGIPRHKLLELHFLDRASQLVARHSLRTACWDDCLLLEVDKDANAARSRRAARKPVPTAYVWNSVWGWGREDAAYRLANAGFDVVLCNAPHLYFDLACEKDPAEPGYYWAGFVGMRAPFEFVPLEIYKNAERNSMGHPLSQDELASRVRLTRAGIQNIRGLQGQLWSENIRGREQLEYMAFPRTIALAERAWAGDPSWADIDDPAKRQLARTRDWNQFANRLGQVELPRLDHFPGGVHYRLPPPGASERGGLVAANVAFPGLQIRYTTDGSEPTAGDELYKAPFRVVMPQTIHFKSFDTRGRTSRKSVVDITH
jgi:hexosaminidase